MLERTGDLSAWQSELLQALQHDVAGEDEAAAAATPVQTGRVEVLAFELAGEVFGVDIREMAEILLPREVTALPRTPGFVLGVLSLRGAVLPVIDLACRLRLPPAQAQRASRIVVLKDGEERVGFRVDRVRGVVRFSDDAVEATDYATAVDPQFLRGIGYDREANLVAVLSAAKLCDFSLEEG